MTNLTSELINTNKVVAAISSIENCDTQAEILDAFDCYDLSDVYDLQEVQNQVLSNELDTDDYDDEEEDFEDVVNMKLENGLQVWRLSCHSNLYGWLLEWYGSEKTLLKKVRSAVLSGNVLYFASGVGYDWIDSDLLNNQGTSNYGRDLFYDLTNGKPMDARGSAYLADHVRN